MKTRTAETATGTAISTGESEDAPSSADRCVSGLALSMIVLLVPGTSLNDMSDVVGAGAGPFDGPGPPPYEGLLGCQNKFCGKHGE